MFLLINPILVIIRIIISINSMYIIELNILIKIIIIIKNNKRKNRK